MLGTKEVLRKNLLVSKYCDKRGTAVKRSDICGKKLVRFGEEGVTEERTEQGKHRAEARADVSSEASCRLCWDGEAARRRGPASGVHGLKPGARARSQS